MWQDGVCRVTDHYYTKTIQFQDINYQLAQNDDKTSIFEGWCDFLNYFDSSIHLQLSFLNLTAEAEAFEQSILIPDKGDGFNDVRHEYALYQLKPDPQYHELRYSSLSELQSAADHMFSDVQHIVQASEGLLFPSKAAVETYLESKGLSTVACADPTSIHVENEAFQSATIHLACGDGGCWIESCEQVPSIQTVTEKRYHLVYTGDLPDDCVSLEEPDALLEDLFFRFNSCHPKDFHGRSMSVSDVVALTVNGQTSCYYTNSIPMTSLRRNCAPHLPAEMRSRIESEPLNHR